MGAGCTPVSGGGLEKGQRVIGCSEARQYPREWGEHVEIVVGETVHDSTQMESIWAGVITHIGTYMFV